MLRPARASVAEEKPMSTLTLERRGHVLLIGLDRAAKRNAFNLDMLRDLGLAFAELESDPELRCAVLHAAGDHFTAGLDLAEVGPAVQSGERIFPEGGHDPLGLWGPARTKPLVVAVQGYCFTIGIELMLAADICVAAESTVFAQMEVQRGIMAFGGATLRLPRVAGWGNAMLWLLTGDRFDAAEAQRIGLVQRVVPEGEQLDGALEIAQRIAAQAPLAVQATLRSARTAAEQGPDAAKSSLYEQTRSLMTSEDAQEGVRSFLERRAAKFSGR